MITVIILDNHEPKVIELTYENLYRELKDISGSELLVREDWFDFTKIKNKYICLVESDCLVSEEYFSNQLAEFASNPYLRKLAMLSGAVGTNYWTNLIYGYSLGNRFYSGVIPTRKPKSSNPYPVEIGYVPGAIIRTETLKSVIEGIDLNYKDLIDLSTQISLAFWRKGDGNRIHVNPNVTYVTTEQYVNDVGDQVVEATDLVNMFESECI